MVVLSRVSMRCFRGCTLASLGVPKIMHMWMLPGARYNLFYCRAMNIQSFMLACLRVRCHGKSMDVQLVRPVSDNTKPRVESEVT
jgi:hypothetical protein